MGKKLINRKRLMNNPGYTQLGDVCYFTSLDYWDKVDLQSVDLEWQDWMKKFFKAGPVVGVLKEAANTLVLQRLQTEYEFYFYRHKKEPDWMAKLPLPNQRYIRNQFLISNEEVDPLVIIPSLPFGGFGYIIEDGSYTERIVREFGLWRLQGIKQLGYLHYPTIKPDGADVLVREFPHNRYVHSLDVRAVAKLILANNNRSELEHALCDMATLTHDTLTPAGGDSIKWIDQKLFDEDLHYPELMNKIDWEKFPEIPENGPELLPQIILNRGILGQVLDIADKVAYVGRDLSAFYIQGPPKLAGHEEIKRLLKQQRQPCSVWETARIKGDQLYFVEPKRLINFLMIRATLFSRLYQHPSSRFKELFVKTVTQKRLYETGKLTRDQLLQMQDIHLQTMLGKEIGHGFMDSFVGLNGERMETFGTKEQAEARKKQIIASGRPVVMMEKAFTAKAGVHFMVKTKHGLMSLSDAEPEASALIRNLMKPDYEYGLHYLDMPKDELPEVLRSWHTWAN